MFTHHNASMQVIAEGPNQCRFVWVTDLLPDETAGPVGDLIEQAAPIMKRTLESRPR
jgi:hypothetical protein